MTATEEDLDETIDVELRIGIASTGYALVEMTRRQYRELCERIDAASRGRGAVDVDDAPVNFDDVIGQLDFEIEEADAQDDVEREREAARRKAAKASKGARP